jgi:hypothetical protein
MDKDTDIRDFVEMIRGAFPNAAEETERMMQTLRWFLVAWLLLSPARAANADMFFKLVTYFCNEHDGYLEIYYQGAWNEYGQELLDQRSENAWDTDSLEVTARVCQLSDGPYQVEIGPSRGNVNYRGRCGGESSAYAVVRKDERLITRTSFEGDCHYSDTVVTNLVVRPDPPRVERTEVKTDEFYGDF